LPRRSAPAAAVEAGRPSSPAIFRCPPPAAAASSAAPITPASSARRSRHLFPRLPSHRDRALAAFWVSTGARASELLGATVADADPGRQLVTVIRKGTRAMQQLPASPDAFVWLWLYQSEFRGQVPEDGTTRCGGRCAGRSGSWAITPPALCSPAPAACWARTARFTTCVTPPPTGWRATRECRSPTCNGSSAAHLSTTQVYVTPAPDNVIASVLAHHRRQREGQAAPPPAPAAGYRPETLDALFGRRP
jgi:integrase